MHNVKNVANRAKRLCVVSSDRNVDSFILEVFYFLFILFIFYFLFIFFWVGRGAVNKHGLKKH